MGSLGKSIWRGVRGFTDASRSIVGLKGPPSKKTQQNKRERRMTDPLSQDQVGAIYEQMGQDVPDSAVFKRRQRRKGRGLSGMVQDIQAQQDQGLGG